METSATQLDIIHELLGGDICVDGIGMPELSDPCVLGGVDDEGTTAAFGGLVQIEIVLQQFLDGLGGVADNKSDVVWYLQVYNYLCGRGEHPILLRFVTSVKGYDPP